MPRSTFETEDEDHAFASIIHAGTLDTWLDHIQMFVDEFRLRIDSDGYHVRAWNKSQSGLVDTHLNVRAFDSHRAGTLVVGVESAEDLQDVIGIADKSELLSVRYDEGSRMLHIRGEEFNKSFGLIDPAYIPETPNRPEVDLPTVITIPGKKLKTAVKLSDTTSDHVVVGYYDANSEGRQQGLYFAAQGDTDDSLYEPSEQEIHESGASDTLLSCHLVEYISKEVDASTDVTITYGTDMPVFFEWTEDDQYDDPDEIEDEFDNAAIETTAILAPRIRTD